MLPLLVVSKFRPTYTDDEPMPWGEHKGKRLGDVPSSYLSWLASQSWIIGYQALHAYLEKNRDQIRAQAAVEESLKGDVDPIGPSYETFEDYRRAYRGF